MGVAHVEPMRGLAPSSYQVGWIPELPTVVVGRRWIAPKDPHIRHEATLPPRAGRAWTSPARSPGHATGVGAARVERMRGLAAILVGVLLLLLLPSRARAGGIEIVTIDGTLWPSLVEQIQDDAGSEGRRYYLVVRDGGIDVPCSDYQLSLDAVATAAFRVVGCDASTSATMLRLVNRAALFAEGDVVPRALRATLTATISHHASVDGGGAPDQGGSKIWCSVALQPYLSDRLRGPWRGTYAATS
jgi:hypothetical protein